MKGGTEKAHARRRMRLKGIALLIGLAAVLLVAYQGGRWLENRNAKPEPRGDLAQRQSNQETIEIDGTLYRRRSGLTAVLLMGIDQDSDAAPGGYRNGGQADFLRLMVIDARAKTITQLSIDRDTMTPITILGVLGNPSGMRTAQISLSHGFGDGGAQSCELTVEAVSNLLLGEKIDFYVAMNLDGISVLNDAVGGITVTLEDDFSTLDPAMTAGTTLTLVGDQAEYYVRSRMNIGIGTNEARMARQEEYLSALGEKLGARIAEDQAFIEALYEALGSYLTTDMSRGRMINEVWASREYASETVLELAGEHEVGADGFMQFYVEEGSIEQAVLQLFYEKVE